MACNRSLGAELGGFASPFPAEMGLTQERLGKKLENMSLAVEAPFTQFTLFLLIFTSAMGLSFFVSIMNAWGHGPFSSSSS